MQINEIMTKTVEFIHGDTTLKDAAEKMRTLDCGFLPVGDQQEEKLAGVITDRDITVRGVAGGLDPNTDTVKQISTRGVLYCFEGDSLDEAADSMSEQKVYRLIVLNNKDDKKLSGVVSLGDIVRKNEEKLAGHVAKGIAA